MEMEVSFPGGARVDASFGGYTVQTDQPPQGAGQASAPTPFALFLASVATCAGIYVLGFLRQRGLPSDGVRVRQMAYSDPLTGMIGQIELAIEVPPGFPEKYLPAMARAAELCAVKKHLEHPPHFVVRASSVESQIA
jgi:putative redox protein